MFPNQSQKHLNLPTLINTMVFLLGNEVILHGFDKNQLPVSNHVIKSLYSNTTIKLYKQNKNWGPKSIWLTNSFIQQFPSTLSFNQQLAIQINFTVTFEFINLSKSSHVKGILGICQSADKLIRTLLKSSDSRR